ncbi:S-layer homology domain-containing protein [Paenibacillus sp. DMB20]|uniref:S-layer homology domain-containing protein n=1 Tax=Paenibacillus sp. DMB20 TaxID=1642570 RepID=UPI000627A1E1|nr:S-layer homology domain-containing protein [Paenibacillus sp. DMB20]KKO53101.1 hypothetical protein XI25_15565 [Paenibacillus sp. DMB20]
MNGYKLLPGSPAINAGLDIRAKTPSVWGAADKDFFNNPIIDEKIDIGAHEYSNDEPGNQSPEVLPSSIKLSHDKLDLYAQQAGKTLAAAFEPQDAWFKGVKWSSSDAQVAAVNSSGFVMPMKPGEATIRAESTVNPSVYAEAHVTVHEASEVVSYQVASDHNELSEAGPQVRLRIDGVTEDGLVMEHAPYTHVRYKANHDQVTIDQETGVLKAVGDLSGTDEIEVSADVEEYKDLLYTQSFEAGWGDFMPETGTEIQTGAISDAVAYQGNKSALFVTGNGSNAIQKLFGSKQQGIVTMMMYDDGSKSAKTRVVAHVGNARSTLLAGMGLLYDGSSYGSLDYYSVRASNVSSAWEETPVKRSKGWHELKWDYTSGVDLKMYIDGQLVKTTTAIKDFDRIVLGFLWDAANGRTFAFDNVKYASTDEKVTKQAAKLTLPVRHKIDKTVLEQTITAAQSVYEPAVEGNEPGQYPAGSKALLFDAIERAREVLGKEKASQAEVDAAVAALQEAVSLFQASVIVNPGAPVDKSKLNEAITAAKAVYAEAVEGTEPGQYPSEAMLRLFVAIEKAEDVWNGEDVAQNDIHAAVLALNAAVAEFKSSMNPDRTAPTWKHGKLKADQASTSSITLTWSGEVIANQVKDYKIYRDGMEIATVTGSVYRYDVTGLNPDTSYTFKVEAGNEHDHWSSDGPSARVKTDGVTSGSGGSGGGSSTYVPAPSVPKTEDPEKTKPTKPAEEGGQADAGQPKPTKPNAELTDVKGHWAEKAIREAVELGWVQGYKDGTFRPDAKISRAEFAVLLGRALKLERQENVKFKR